ncbi:MAG TPA: ParA family protein [Thermoanaerobaculia bacterium]|nr:ParA family protein [Thermoanaerobaculia bacterium]
MIKIALFNHKGGVGKTTLTVNIGDTLADLGKRVLLVDADPQCNLTAFYIEEPELEVILSESDDAEIASTVWSAIKPVLLSQYEEELPQAWLDSFGRKTRGYDVMAALSNAVAQAAETVNADAVIYDVGPNVGALNRAVLLDCDYFITPVAADLFSLRALTTVGRAIAKWIRDWATVRDLADPADHALLLPGRPAFLGYVTSAYKVSVGRSATDPHADWEKRIAPRVRDRIVDDLRRVDPSLVPKGGNKLGGIKNFHSLAAAAQKYGVALGKLKGHVNAGYYRQIDEAYSEFQQLSHEIIKRTGV